MLSAIAAAVGHGLHALNRRDRQAATVGAGHFASPAVLLEILAGSSFAGEALEELIEADGFKFVGYEL